MSINWKKDYQEKLTKAMDESRFTGLDIYEFNVAYFDALLNSQLNTLKASIEGMKYQMEGGVQETWIRKSDVIKLLDKNQ